MRIKQFDVVELKNKNKAIILNIEKRKKYLAKIINNDRITSQTRIITNDDIVKIIYKKIKKNLFKGNFV